MKNSWRRLLKGKKGELPFVSVIIPAKSEVVYTKECLDSLPNQDYRPNKYEIVARMCVLKLPSFKCDRTESRPPEEASMFQACYHP